jgi:hypothetical protein
VSEGNSPNGATESGGHGRSGRLTKAPSPQGDPQRRIAPWRSERSERSPGIRTPPKPEPSSQRGRLPLNAAFRMRRTNLPYTDVRIIKAKPAHVRSQSVPQAPVRTASESGG